MNVFTSHMDKYNYSKSQDYYKHFLKYFNDNSPCSLKNFQSKYGQVSWTMRSKTKERGDFGCFRDWQPPFTHHWDEKNKKGTSREAFLARFEQIRAKQPKCDILQQLLSLPFILPSSALALDLAGLSQLLIFAKISLSFKSSFVDD